MTSLCIFRRGRPRRDQPPPGPALTTFESGGCGDAMPESANDASGTRFSDDDGGDDDDDDDDERADIVDEYRARIRYCLPLSLSPLPSVFALWLVSYYAHTLSRYDIYIYIYLGLSPNYRPG